MKQYIREVLRGADPEVFLRRKDDKKYISAIGIIGGSKEQPRRLERNIFVQEDNVLAEFNIAPVKTGDKFNESIKLGIKRINDLLPPELEVDISPYAFFDKDQLNNKKACEFGCMPDTNCWTMLENIPPEAEDVSMRTAAGHMHFSWDKPIMEVSQKLGKALDLYAAVPSTIMSDELPRRKLYGKMGSVRFKRYGLEYRTLSNFWLKSDDLIDWAYETSEKAIEFVNADKNIDEQTQLIMGMAINDGNKDAAEYLIAHYNLPVINNHEDRK